MYYLKLHSNIPGANELTPFGLEMPYGITELRSSQAIIGLGTGLMLTRRQAITITCADLLWIRHVGTNFSETWIKI